MSSNHPQFHPGDPPEPTQKVPPDPPVTNINRADEYGPPPVLPSESPDPASSTTQAPALTKPETLRAAALVAGLIAGAASWLGGEMIVLIRTADQEFVAERPGMIGQLDVLATEAMLWRAMISYAVLGGALGLTMGLAGGLLKRSLPMALGAGLSGAILGGGIVALATKGLLPMFVEDVDRLTSGLVAPIMMHASIWSIAGALGGLAFGVGLGDRMAAFRAVLGGLIGALIGTVIFELIGAIAWPTQETWAPISRSGGSRLLARMSVCLMAALFAAVFISSEFRAKRTTAETREIA